MFPISLFIEEANTVVIVTKITNYRLVKKTMVTVISSSTENK